MFVLLVSLTVLVDVEGLFCFTAWVLELYVEHGN